MSKSPNRSAQLGAENDKHQHPGLARMKVRLVGIVPRLPHAPRQSGYNDAHEARRAALYALITDAAPGINVGGEDFGALDAECFVLASEEQIRALRSRFGIEHVTPYWEMAT